MKKIHLPPLTDYDVGYRKPPESTRFKPGQSGNPKGRPKGARNRPQTQAARIIDLMREATERQVTILEGGKKIRITAREAVTRRLVVDAMQGKVGAAKVVTAILREGDRND